MTDELVKENQLVVDSSTSQKKNRTQDLKITMHQYEEIKEFKDFANTEQQWLNEFQNEDMLREITKNDKIYSYYKYDRKSNYKSNMQNSLGLLEHPETFALLHSLITTLGQIKTTKDKNAAAKELIEKLKI